MVEKLLSYATLLACGVISFGTYEEYLNEVFLQWPNSSLLVELQWCAKDSEKTMATILEYSKKVEIDYTVFGKLLVGGLETAYKEMPIDCFAAKAYSIWGRLPKGVECTEPFFTLLYAGDPLSWGDENQTRAMYEKMFGYYESNGKL